MKIKGILSILIILFFASNIYSLDLHERFGVGANVGFYEPDMMGGTNLYTDSESIIGGHVRFFVRKNWSILAKYQHYQHDDVYKVTANTGYQLGNPGDLDFREFGKGTFTLDIKPFNLLLNYHFAESDNPRIIPYLGVGATYMDFSYKYRRNTNYSAVNPADANALGGTQDWADFDVSEGNWGFVTVAGIEFFTNPNFSISGEIAYRSAEAELDIAPNLINNAITREVIDGEGFSYTFAFTYYFPHML